jgi:hypothetical protein
MFVITIPEKCNLFKTKVYLVYALWLILNDLVFQSFDTERT